jgi:hypothetical protein
MKSSAVPRVVPALPHRRVIFLLLGLTRLTVEPAR